MKGGSSTRVFEVIMYILTISDGGMFAVTDGKEECRVAVID
jgi:hypothetical protein